MGTVSISACSCAVRLAVARLQPAEEAGDEGVIGSERLVEREAWLTMRRSASTATLVAICASVSRSWVTSTTVSPARGVAPESGG